MSPRTTQTSQRAAGVPVPTPCEKEASLDYILEAVFNLPQDGILKQALHRLGIKSFHDLLDISFEEIEFLEYLQSQAPDPDGDPQPDALVAVPRHMKASLRGFCGYLVFRSQELNDPITEHNVLDIEPQVFRDYRYSGHYVLFRLRREHGNFHPVQPRKSRTPAPKFSQGIQLDSSSTTTSCSLGDDAADNNQPPPPPSPPGS